MDYDSEHKADDPDNGGVPDAEHRLSMEYDSKHKVDDSDNGWVLDAEQTGEKESEHYNVNCKNVSINFYHSYPEEKKHNKKGGGGLKRERKKWWSLKLRASSNGKKPFIPLSAAAVAQLSPSDGGGVVRVDGGGQAVVHKLLLGQHATAEVHSLHHAASGHDA